MGGDCVEDPDVRLWPLLVGLLLATAVLFAVIAYSTPQPLPPQALAGDVHVLDSGLT
jgi:hypothetical protein